MENKIVPRYLQERAKSIVDMLFDGKMFNESITRDDMKFLEDFIAEEYQSLEESVRKWVEIMAKLKHLQEWSK